MFYESQGTSVLDSQLQKIEAKEVKYLKGTFMQGQKAIKVYRGMSLPEKAIDFYKKVQKTQDEFQFNGYLSTTVDKSLASEFAFLNV